MRRRFHLSFDPALRIQPPDVLPVLEKFDIYFYRELAMRALHFNEKERERERREKTRENIDVCMYTCALAREKEERGRESK